MYSGISCWNFSVGNQTFPMHLDRNYRCEFPRITQNTYRNKGHNNYMSFPLLLGIIGLFFKLKSIQSHFTSNLMLFLMIGEQSWCFYLNSASSRTRGKRKGDFYIYWVASMHCYLGSMRSPLPSPHE